MPQVRGKLGKLAINVAPFAIPAHKRPRSETVPHVVEAWSSAMLVPARGWAKADSTRYDREVVLGTPVRDAMAPIGNKERGTRRARKKAIPLPRITPQRLASRVVERHEARLPEFPVPNLEDPGIEVDVVAVESERLTKAQAGRCEQAEKRGVRERPQPYRRREPRRLANDPRELIVTVDVRRSSRMRPFSRFVRPCIASRARSRSVWALWMTVRTAPLCSATPSMAG